MNTGRITHVIFVTNIYTNNFHVQINEVQLKPNTCMQQPNAGMQNSRKQNENAHLFDAPISTEILRRTN